MNTSSERDAHGSVAMLKRHRPTNRNDAFPHSFDLVVPALNEEDRIGPTIRAISDFVAHDRDTSAARRAGRTWTVRLIVVDNGSVDGTAEAVDLARRADIPVEVIGCRRRGKGAAVRAGVLHSSAAFVGYCDADLSTPVSAIREGLLLLEAGWDIVIGSRRCFGAEYVVPQSRMRRAGSALFHGAAARLAHRASDTQCGFKLFRAEVAAALFSTGVIDGFAFDVEILARARHHHDFRMIELPIHWVDKEGSTFRPVIDGVQSFRDLRHVQRALRHSPVVLV